MGINVNFYDKIIYITSPTVTVTVQDLVNAIREAECTEEGMGFAAIIDATGKDDLGGGVSTGITMTLNSLWYIEFWSGVSPRGVVKDGNVVGGLSDVPVRAASGSGDTVLQLGAVDTTIAEGGGSGGWDSLLADYNDPGTFGEAVNFMFHVEGGRWRIVSNQMIFYKADGVTEVARFNLYDSGGQPAETGIFDRQRV